MKFLKQYGVVLAVAAAILVIAGGWLAVWKQIGSAMHDAEYAEAFSQFTYHGAYYARVSAAELNDHFPEPRTPEDIAGEKLDDITLATPRGKETCTLYAAGEDGAADGQNPLTVLQCGAGWFAYEVSGFESLGDAPSVTAVCKAYGLNAPEDILSVSVADTDGEPLAELTDSESLRAFYDKLTALGDDIGEEGQSKAYYDAYTEKYGTDAGVSFSDGKIQFADDDANTRAMEFWAEGMRLVTIRLRNGFRLRNLVYAPVPKVFSVYGHYRFDEAICD